MQVRLEIKNKAIYVVTAGCADRSSPGQTVKGIIVALMRILMLLRISSQ